MENNKITPLIQALNNLLTLQSLHAISYQFDKIAETLREEKLKVELIESKTFYITEELAFVHEKKNEAGKFEEAAMWRSKEKELLDKYADTEAVVLKQEPSFFEYKKSRMIGYLCREKQNERLIWNLIEAYMLKRN